MSLSYAMMTSRQPATNVIAMRFILRHVQDRVEHLQVRQADAASLPRQAVFDLGELRGGDLH